MAKRYAVEVNVTYHVTAENIAEAYENIHEGAEYPVLPYNDDTYCAATAITSVKELSNANIHAISHN